MLMVLSPDLVVQAVNRAFENATGHDRATMIGRPVFEVFPGEPSGHSENQLRTSFKRVLDEGEADVMALQRYDLRAPDASGTFQERYWNVANAPVLGPDGTVNLIVQQGGEVTEYVDRLRQVHAPVPPIPADASATRMLGLEAELFARTRELHEVNQRLLRKQASERNTIETLRQAIRRQREAVADTSHDLKGPIAGLQTRLEAALDDPDIDLRQIVLAALQDAQRLGDIVAELLELTRLESGAPVATEPVDLAHLVNTELARRHPAIPIATRLDPHTMVSASPMHLIRLLNNLIGNAERHARTKIEVSVATTARWAVLEVIDDGPGIPAAERDAVFERFYRHPDVRHTDPAGTGLGLPIARRIAHNHGGTLDVADSPAGARLVLRLPLLPHPLSSAAGRPTGEAAEGLSRLRYASVPAAARHKRRNTEEDGVPREAGRQSAREPRRA
jgi:PAS domain S-box-containing protein